jgi:hypothetical protein
MAKFAATDYSVTINAGTVSSFLQSVDLSLESDDLETTAFGSTSRTRIGGLKTGTTTLNFFQDFGASGIDQLIFPLFNTIGTVVIKPANATVTATNPSYSFECLINAYQPFASSVGDIATLSVSWPVSGNVTRGTGA